MLLLVQRLAQLGFGDHAHGGERLTNAHHGHGALLFNGPQQLLGGHDLAGEQNFAQALVAQAGLFVHGQVDLSRRDA